MNHAFVRGTSRRIDRVNTWVGLGMGAVMLFMVLLGAYNAIARKLDLAYDLGLSGNSLLELQWQCFAAIFLLGSAYTLRMNSHVRVDVLYDRISPRARSWINLVGTVVLLVPFCLAMCWFSLDPVRQSWAQRETTGNFEGLAIYPIKSCVPIAFLLLAAQGVSEVIKSWISLKEPEEINPPHGQERL